ncbi:MAG: hypothetical protein ACI90V_001628 [Bacillariaceae sp.]|jgi:hypothetical protein
MLIIIQDNCTLLNNTAAYGFVFPKTKTTLIEAEEGSDNNHEEEEEEEEEDDEDVIVERGRNEEEGAIFVNAFIGRWYFPSGRLLDRISIDQQHTRIINYEPKRRARNITRSIPVQFSIEEATAATLSQNDTRWNNRTKQFVY